MPNNGLNAGGLTGGATYYFRAKNQLGQYLYTAAPAFEAFNAAHIASYVVSAGAANSTGGWFGTFPANAATVSGVYDLDLCQRVGGSGAVSDPIQGTQTVYWNGTDLWEVTASIGAGKIASPQSFNNTGQVTAVPAIPSPGYSVESVLNGSASTTYTGVTIQGALNYSFNFTWTKPVDYTGWTQFVFTAKTSETDADSAAILTVKLSSPGVGTDGLTLLNGAAPVSPVTKTDGALVVTITPAAGLVPASTAIQLTLTARGMGLTVGESLTWEITAYNSGGVKLPVVDGGIFDAEGTVRVNPIAS